LSVGIVSIDGSELPLASNVTVSGAIPPHGFTLTEGCTVYDEFIFFIACVKDL
jgi:hypothetical protein